MAEGFGAPIASDGTQLSAAWAEAKARMPRNIVEAHGFSLKHRETILASERCGCFHCEAIFAPAHVVHWADDGQTATCPFCGIDSVLPSKSVPELSRDLLAEMNRYWF